ncbi:hypothetical protein OEZ86_011670 [Tetradesmus obliquus]|uniref:Uncharacterized protein n=2 Tax=Tetradesmus obliquus TaxID=3088 RepID=A0ABY8TJ78_TETOB|nr:hypothetical protein OEZ85_008498 [Tetradesmus obliquus]WIA29159.1 hypothetical protein OEZ86_011670 [Tetradesmus obliquus]|eukprot:jgi/Sobl393_1/2646/SZX66701.1
MADDDQHDMAEETNTSRQGAEQAKALDLVTDNVPEKELDQNKVKQAMAALAAAQKADKEAQIKREKELAAVKVTQADIDVIAAEAEVDKKLAERRLREHNGNLLEALRSFL